MNYTRSQCSRIFGISMESLRYLESMGLIAPNKGTNNRCLYSPDEVMKLLDLRKLKALGLSNEEMIHLHCTGEDRIPHAQLYDNTLERLIEEEKLLEERIRYIRCIRQTLDDIKTEIDHLMIGERPQREFVLFDEADSSDIAYLMAEGLPYLNYAYWVSVDQLRGATPFEIHLAMDILALASYKPQLYQEISQRMPVHVSPAGMKIFCYRYCRDLNSLSPEDFKPLLDYANLHRYQIKGDLFGGIIGPGIRIQDNNDGFILTQTLSIC